MGWSEETPNFDLPLFADTDKPSWRGDVNYAFSIIDDALNGTDLVSAARFGMSPNNTGADNKVALLAAHSYSAGQRAVYVPAGTYDMDAITDLEFGDYAPRLVGAGCRVLTTERWDVGSPNWATFGPSGTVLRCSTALTANDAFIHIGARTEATSPVIRNIGFVGTGAGIGLRVGDDVSMDAGTGHPVRWVFDSLTVANFDTGMTHTGENGVMVAPYIVGCGTGFHAGYPWNGNTVIGINVERVSRCAIRLNHAITNVFSGGVLQASAPEEATIIVENSSHGNVFEGIYSENYAPTTGDHPNVLREMSIGPAGGGGPCYANRFRNMHWGAQSVETPESEIIVYNAYFTEIVMGLAASGTTQPTVHLDGGWGHDIIGAFPDVVGSRKNQGRLLHTTGAANASEVVEVYGWNLSTEGYVKVGNAITADMPNPVDVGDGGLHRDQQYGLIMESDAGTWEPLVSRVRPFATTAGGVVDGAGATASAWTVYTHIKFDNATEFVLWPTSVVARSRLYTIRNATAVDFTLSTQSGETIDGGSSVTIPANSSVSVYVPHTSSEWITA